MRNFICFKQPQSQLQITPKCCTSLICDWLKQNNNLFKIEHTLYNKEKFSFNYKLWVMSLNNLPDCFYVTLPVDIHSLQKIIPWDFSDSSRLDLLLFWLQCFTSLLSYIVHILVYTTLYMVKFSTSKSHRQITLKDVQNRKRYMLIILDTFPFALSNQLRLPWYPWSPEDKPLDFNGHIIFSMHLNIKIYTCITLVFGIMYHYNASLY